MKGPKGPELKFGFYEQTEYEFIPPSHPLMEAIITQGNIPWSITLLILFICLGPPATPQSNYRGGRGGYGGRGGRCRQGP